MTFPFFMLCAIILAALCATMRLRNLVHCVLALMVGLIGLAVVYLEMGAQFVGLTQILVYVGAVGILAVFAIMTTESAEPSTPHRSRLRFDGVLLSGAMFSVLGWAICVGALPMRSLTFQPQVSVREIGVALMQKFVLPLEIMGVLLTVALIGAAVLAMRDVGEPR